MVNSSLFPSSYGYNYTGLLTRSIVFTGALLVFLAGAGMTIGAIIIPDWISYNSITDYGTRIRYSYGLSKRCSNTAGSSHLGTNSLGTDLACIDFPPQDCHGEDRYFCSMWRTVGFLMSFAVVVEGMTIATFLILITGGKQRREHGWPVLATLTGLAALVQAIAMGLMAYVYENDDRFFEGWILSKSWMLCTTSWAMQIFAAIIIALASLCLPTEGGYELIPDRHEDEEP